MASFLVDRTYSQGPVNDTAFEQLRYNVSGSIKGVCGGIFAYGVRLTLLDSTPRDALSTLLLACVSLL